MTDPKPPSVGEKEEGCCGLGIEVSENLVTMDVEDVDISLILKEIALKARIGLFVDKEIDERISIKLRGVPVEEALKRLCQSRSLVYEFKPETGQYKIIQAGAYVGKKEAEKNINIGDYPSEGGPGKEIPPQELDGDTFLPRIQTSKPGDEQTHDTKGRPLYKPGELLVRFEKGVSQKQILDLHERLGSRVLKRIDRLRLERVKLKQGVTEQEAIAFYSASDMVESVERHALRYPNEIVPNDTHFEEQWGLASIRAPEAWEFTRGNPEVIIAVIDTGVNYLHPDLSKNIWTNGLELNGTAGVDDDGNGFVDDIHGWDFAGNYEFHYDDSDPDPMDMEEDGHGTHVAGIIGAVGNNGKGISGVDWNVKIMPLKVQADDSISFEEMDIIHAIQYAVDNGAHIVNCSFGSGSFSENEQSAFEHMQSRGILAVCAAGNETRNNDITPNYPSSYDLTNILAVAAGDRNDNLAYFSNWGLSSVDIMAPGVDIKSTANTTLASVVLETGSIIPATGMSYAGLTDEDGISGLLYYCGEGYEQEFPEGVNGYIALIKRGVIEFSEKTANAQAAGAVAVIIYNNVPGSFSGTLQEQGNWIPVVSISDTDGALLLETEFLHPSVTVINNPADYGYRSGTSMAAPHVTGVAGLLLSYKPVLDAVGIKSIILDTVDKIDELADKMVSGGSLNSLRALSSLLKPGDLDCNGIMGLEDAILGLQLLAGADFSLCAASGPAGMDVNGDGIIGMEEILYIIKRISYL